MITIVLWLAFVTICAADSNLTCQNGASFDVGNYLYLSNNEWGRQHGGNGYYQCIQLIGSNNNEYKITYFWNTNNQSSPYSVKSFPMVVAGWNPGVGYRYGAGAGNIPFQVKDKPKVITTWNTIHSNTNTSMMEIYDVAWDIWLGKDNVILNVTGQNSAQTEIMIWTSYTPKTDPIGKVIANNLSFWGYNWILYGGVGSGHSFTTYSFLYQGHNIWNLNNVDLNDIFAYLNDNKYINDTQYVCGILAGIELRQGQGEFTYTTYTLNIS
eukprot:65106_1